MHHLLLRLSGALLVCALFSGCPQTIAAPCGSAGDACCGGGRCDLGAECSAQNVCQACGGENEACCSSGCRAGLRCEDQVCSTPVLCGGLHEACCAGSSCSNALRCDNGSCVQPCGDGCAPGDKRCNSNGGVDLCGYSTAPCTAWTNVITRCPTGETCEAGACLETCPGACVLQSTLCTSEGVKICQYDSTSGCPVYKIAPESPDNPVCMTGACDGPICWESPLPQGNALGGVTGWAADELLFPDSAGNLLRLNDTAWEYDWRNAQGGAFSAVSNCTQTPTRSFAVGQGGRAWLRNSIGWQLEHVGDASASLYAVACDGSTRAVAAGLQGKAFWRSDTGVWSPLPTGTTRTLFGIGYDPFGTWAYLVGEAGTILRCGPLAPGTSVTCAPEGSGLTTVSLRAAWSRIDGSEVVAVGDKGTVLVRDSNGNWSQVAQSVVGGDLNAVWGLDSNSDVYAAGDGGAFLHRLGANWLAETFTSENLTGVYAPDDTHLFASGRSGGIWSNDARGSVGPSPQQHWRQVGGRAPVPADSSLNAITGTGISDVFAVGEGGRVLHKSGDAWRTEATGLTTADLNGVTEVSIDEVYAVGLNGTLLGRRFGVWKPEGMGVTSNPLFGTWNDGTTVYAVGAGGTWLEKPVGASGNLWTRVTQSATTEPLMAIAGNANEVWAVGPDCTVLVKKDGQFHTFAPEGCNGDALWSVWLGADGEAWIGGDGAVLLHRSADGTWTREYVGTTLETIYSVVPWNQDVWATASSGELYHRTAGSWRQEAEGLTFHDLYSAFATPEGHLFFAGSGGLIWHRR